MQLDHTQQILKFAKDEFKRLKKNPRTKEESIAILHQAGILTKKGNFTKNYPELRKFSMLSK